MVYAVMITFDGNDIELTTSRNLDKLFYNLNMENGMTFSITVLNIFSTMKEAESFLRKFDYTIYNRPKRINVSIEHDEVVSLRNQLIKYKSCIKDLYKTLETLN